MLNIMVVFEARQVDSAFCIFRFVTHLRAQAPMIAISHAQNKALPPILKGASR
jgi:hypothetical protein